MSALKTAESAIIRLPLRLALGGLFVFAAWMKLQDPQSFAEAIKGFKMLDPALHETLIASMALMIPWVEMVAGLMLIVGLWTRASAALIGLALLAFIGGLLSVIFRGIDTHCSCFGSLSFGCPDSIGWCQILRNTVMLIPAAILVCFGGGQFALDRVLTDRAAVRVLDDDLDGR